MLFAIFSEEKSEGKCPGRNVLEPLKMPSPTLTFKEVQSSRRGKSVNWLCCK